ncbi:MAG: hypothetical protein CMN80_11905 [Spongiibacter sp.]|nr:hypothetical protein [Spongiibacter sp.]
MVDDETLLPPLGAGDAASVFPSSVASGDPTPSGVILWTRLEQSAIEPDQDVLWEVAEDERFLRRVAEHYGASPTLVYLESPVVVDNVSGEVISD